MNLKVDVRSRTLVAGLVGIVVVLAVTALATGAALPATATVCVKPNGQVRVVTPSNPSCAEPESSAEWTINGVKAITAGDGLVGRDDGGIVSLSVDPGLIENANSGKIIAGFDDGPHELPDDFSVIAQLPLPAGSYAIFAKLSLRYPPSEGTAASIATVGCKLFAGADFDEAAVTVEPFQAEGAIFGQGTDRLGLGLEVVHRFESDSRALLACSDSSFFFQNGTVVYEDLKIIAIRGSSLSNTFLGD